MDYKDFIKPNERVVYMPDFSNLGWWCNFENCVVKVGEYSPYYTNGSPDPKPEEFNEYCYVEAYPESEKVYESQFRLEDLHPIKKADEEISILHGSERGKLIGKVLSYEYDFSGDSLVRTWKENGYAVIESENGWLVVDEDEIVVERNILDLSEEELKKLRSEIRGGSIYISDYRNSLGIEPNFMSDFYEDFWRSLCQEYGEENAEEHDTPEEFAFFAMA